MLEVLVTSVTSEPSEGTSCRAIRKIDEAWGPGVAGRVPRELAARSVGQESGNALPAKVPAGRWLTD